MWVPDSPFPMGKKWSLLSFASSHSPFAAPLVSVAAVTVSMETGPAQEHHRDRAGGRHGKVSPSPPHGTWWLPGCALSTHGSVEIEIPQVANVWRNPKKAN